MRVQNGRPLRTVTHLLWSLAVLVLAVSVAALSTPARAQQTEGYYVSGLLGASGDFVSENRFEIAGFGVVGDVDADFGPMGVLSAGYAFSSGWRIEAGLSYSRTDVAAVSASLLAAEVGEARTTSLMINGYYDFNKRGRFQPYLGLGLGVISTEFSRVSFTLPGGDRLLDDRATEAAGQAILGLGYWTGDRVFLSAEYRFVTSFQDAEYALSDGSRYEQKLDGSGLLFGLRYAF